MNSASSWPMRSACWWPKGAAHEGRFTSRNDFRGAQAPYQHAVCTCALCEAYGMTHDERLGPLISQAVDYIVKAQRPDGGWTAAYDTTPDVTGKPPKSETSVSAWQIQALKAASLTGIQGIDAAVEPALNLAMKNIDRVYNATDGAFGDHSPDDRNYRFTGAAVLSKLLVLGRPDRGGAPRIEVYRVQGHQLRRQGLRPVRVVLQHPGML